MAAERRAVDQTRARHVARARSVVARRRAALQREEGHDDTLWTMSMADRQTKPFGDVVSQGLPTDAAFSPDGRWVAYQMADADASEGSTYVQPFPATGTKHEIGRGGRPLWSPDRQGAVLHSGARPAPHGPVRRPSRYSRSRRPSAVPRRSASPARGRPRTFDFLPDGRIIGVGSAVQGSNSVERLSQIRVVLNWFAELKARVPVR